MKELTTKEDFKQLKRGDRLHKINDKYIGFDVVGTMPSNENYLILSDGESLEWLHLGNVKYNGKFRPTSSNESGRWFVGEYDTEEVGKVMVDYIDRIAEKIKAVYLKGGFIKK